MHTDQIQKLRSLAAEVRTYQLERGWSDARLCKEIASVGSSKTYKRALDPADDLEDLSLDNQVRNFQSAVETIQAKRKTDRSPEPEYPNFTNCTTAEIAVRRASLEDEECVARLVIIDGQTGTGKDAVRRHLVRRFPNNTVALEANDLWKSSPTTGHLAVYQALKIVKQQDQKTPRTPRDLLAEIIAVLRERKLILIINEAHHMALPGLNMVKTIINATPTVVILEWIPVGGTRLLGSNYEEAIQLTGNRLCERVMLPTPPSDEILFMFDDQGVKFENVEVRNSAAKLLEADAPAYGNWRFVIQVKRKLQELAKRGPVTQAAVGKAIAEVKSMRTRITRQMEA
jgi:hypothetical protein